jgi:hypothetical protein
LRGGGGEEGGLAPLTAGLALGLTVSTPFVLFSFPFPLAGGGGLRGEAGVVVGGALVGGVSDLIPKKALKEEVSEGRRSAAGSAVGG